MNLFSSFLPVHQERSVTGMDAPGTPQVSELIYIYIICVYIYIYIYHRLFSLDTHFSSHNNSCEVHQHNYYCWCKSSF